MTRGKPMGVQLNEILAIDEIATVLKAGERTVYRRAASDKLPAFALGGTWHFCSRELDQWIASLIGKAMVDDGEETK